jgi:CRP-like cAMP-binding protein
MPAQPYARNAFLSALSNPERALFASHLTPRDLCFGECLHRIGDKNEHVIFPHSALVAMTLPSAEGIGAAVMLVGVDGIIGGIAIALSPSAMSDATVYIAGEASQMSVASLRDILDHSPFIRGIAAKFDCAMLAQAQQTAHCNAVHSVEVRLCRWLLEIQDRCIGSKIPLTQSILAQMLGVRRTTVTLIAGRLEAAGLIDTRRGYVQITNREELERHSCECYRQVRKYVAQLFAIMPLSPKNERSTKVASSTDALI